MSWTSPPIANLDAGDLTLDASQLNARIGIIASQPIRLSRGQADEFIAQLRVCYYYLGWEWPE